MTLNILTIVFNGQPFITRHLPVFERLSVPWRWVICHGPANNGGSTGWCKPQQSGSSTDGTWEYLEDIFDSSPNVYVHHCDLWQSKDDMVNAALALMPEDGILLQVDADEIWTTEQLEEIVRLFNDFPEVGSMMFDCRYFVGPDLITVGPWGHRDFEWLRCWRYRAGMRFHKHEPPVLIGESGYRMTKEETGRVGLVFDHFPYALESQVAFKEKYYGYWLAVAGWKRLQMQEKFPVKLCDYFGWVNDDTQVYPLRPPFVQVEHDGKREIMLLDDACKVNGAKITGFNGEYKTDVQWV